MGKKKSNNSVVCIICAILTVFGIVANIISLAGGGNGIWIVNDAANLFLCVLIGYYALSGYRKPHGNLLKYIILIFSAVALIGIYQMVRFCNPWQAINDAIVIGLSCYVAGRLHKVKQNIILLSIVIVLRLIGTVVLLLEGNATIGVITPFIIQIDILVAYVLRYKKHKESGLMDRTA